jgi:cytochrome c biogenesis protein CcmG, thiol:disulfide interchange protein DsbE
MEEMKLAPEEEEIEEAIDETFPSGEVLPQKSFFTLGNIFLLASIVMVAMVFIMALMRQNEGQPTNGPAPDFEITTFEGETFKLSDLKGNVVVLNFWAGWCGPCRDEAPDLQATWERYKDQNVVFIGVAWADNGPSSLAFIEQFGITYYNGPDLETRISEQYNIQGVPETFIIDKDGNIDEFIYAGISERSLSEKIERLLSQG